MTHVAKTERGEREPGVRTVAKLAKALKVSTAELFDGIDGRDAAVGDRGIGFHQYRQLRIAPQRPIQFHTSRANQFGCPRSREIPEL